MRIEAIVCTGALVVVMIAILAHLRVMGREAHWCERVGYSVTFGGALGSALEWWWPSTAEFHGDAIFIVGTGIIAFSVIARFLHGRVAIYTGRWDGCERRARSRSLLTGDPFTEHDWHREWRQ